MKDLTTSKVDRQNVLNNHFALQEMESAIGFYGFMFEEKMCFTKKQVAEFYEVDERTVDRLLEQNKEELERNGYEILTGTRLKKAKTIQQDDIDVVLSHAKSVSLFDFRAFLNLSMLLTESQKAKEVRSTILNIVIDTINKKSGGHTKYINQREENFLISAFEEDDYRKVFTNALDKYVNMGGIKYAIYTNKIYNSIFKENADEYRKILKLSKKDKTRDTFYSEVLKMVSSYENGVAKNIEDESVRLGRKITPRELDVLYKNFENAYEAVLAPHLHDTRRKMASRDLCFRDVLHDQLEEYIEDVSSSDFEKFLGEKSKDLKSRLEDSQEVFKRLKDR